MAVKKVIKPKAKKAAAGKTAKRKTVGKKVAKKKAVKKVAAKKKPVSKKTAKKKVVKKVFAKKLVKKKPAAKKVVKKVVKKVAAKKPVKKKPAAKKAIRKKVIAKNVSKKKPIKTKKVNSVKKTTKKISSKAKSRYGEKELQEFKTLIQGKLDSSRNELKYLHEQINRTAELGSDDSDSKHSGLEDGTGTSEKEYLSQMASRQIQYIDHLEKALVRIANKTYGICRVTGKIISKERLRAVPHATLSIEAKKAQST